MPFSFGQTYGHRIMNAHKMQHYRIAKGVMLAKRRPTAARCIVARAARLGDAGDGSLFEPTYMTSSKRG